MLTRGCLLALPPTKMNNICQTAKGEGKQATGHSADRSQGLPERQEPGGVAATGDRGAAMRPGREQPLQKGKGTQARSVLRGDGRKHKGVLDQRQDDQHQSV